MGLAFAGIWFMELRLHKKQKGAVPNLPFQNSVEITEKIFQRCGYSFHSVQTFN